MVMTAPGLSGEAPITGTSSTSVPFVLPRSRISQFPAASRSIFAW